MKKQLLKKLTFLLLTFIGLCSSQLNAQTELTITDVVEEETFTLGTSGNLTASDAAVTGGTVAITNQDGYIRYIGSGTHASNTATLTFNLKSSGADVTSTLKFNFRKRIGSTISGNVTVDAATTNVSLNGAAASVSFTEATDGTSSGFEDVLVETAPITLTSTAKTIVFTFTELLTGGATNNPQIRFENVTVNKTAVSGGCTEATDVTGLSASAIGAEYTTLSWTVASCSDEVLVVAKATSAVTVTPSGDGSAYAADTAFGSGTDLGTSEFAVYKGTDTSVTVGGLTKGGTTYHYEVFTRKGTDWSDGAVVNATTNNIYTTITSSDNNSAWLTASNWLGESIPSAASDVVVVNARMLITSDVEIDDVTLNGRITVDPGFSVKTKNVTGGGLLIVNAGASSFGSVIVDGTSSAQLIYDRFIEDAGSNDLVSFPITGELFPDFIATRQNANRILVNPVTATNYFVGPFNNATGAFETYDTGTNSATEMVSAKGYRMGLDPADNGSDIRFQGPFPTTNVTIDITDGNHGSFGQWNLIGNPFPSYIDFDTFFTDNTAQFEAGLNNAIYGWTGSAYTVWNAATTLATPGNLIAPTQGFFVKTIDNTTGTVTFNTSRRTNGATNDFSKSANKVNVAIAKLNLSSTTKTFTTDVYFIENQTRGLDSGYDAGAFSGNADGIYTNLVEDNSGAELAIQALPYNDFNNVLVPVTINSEADVTLTISLDKESLTLPSNTNVYFKDNLLNTTTLLNDTDYVFTPDNKLSKTGRFFIQFSSKALSTDDFAANEMLIYSNQKSIIINGVLKTNTNAKVFDIQGRMVLEQKLDSSIVSNVVNANVLNTGIYIVELGGVTQKVIIK